MSFLRSTIVMKPSASLVPRSPVRNQPSTRACRGGLRAGSGSRRRRCARGSRSRPARRSAAARSGRRSPARAISTSTPQIGWPTVPALVPKAGWLVVAVGEVSDSPYPSKMVAWKVSLNFSSTATGSEAPPEMHSRSCGQPVGLGRGLEQPDVHGRHAVEDGHVLPDHQVDRGLAGEPGQQHQRAAEPEGAVHADGLAERVEQRQAAQHHVVSGRRRWRRRRSPSRSSPG